MISDDNAQQLHDKFTRGEPLSPEEQTQLEEWYAVQDKIESQILGLSATTHKTNIAAIQSQVDAALTQLTTVTTRIQDIASENEALKKEISALRRQLAHQTPVMQAAV
jgi:predicted  nucleic acid-binding Zn-ribbon protein